MKREFVMDRLNDQSDEKLDDTIEDDIEDDENIDCSDDERVRLAERGKTFPQNLHEYLSLSLLMGAV
jgi:hypothetical protein